MIETRFLFLFIFILTNLQVEAKNSCNDECLTKTYCVSSDGSGVCSKNNLATAQFKVVPVFGEYDYLQLTLKGYNVASGDEKTIKVSIEPTGAYANVYSCFKSSLGSTYAMFERNTYSLSTGSSYYKDGVLFCTWTFNIYDTIWPPNTDMIKDSSQSITLYNDLQKVKVAQDTSQLPIHHAQYLECCNKVHGNDAFLLTFEQIDKQIRYRLYYWQDNSKKVTINLTRKDGIKLQFECYLYSGVKGHLSNEQISIDLQLTKPIVINAEMCSWATSFVLGDSRISIDASTSVFDLDVQVDSITVYTEKDVALKNSSHLAKLSFILIIFIVLFQIL